MLGSEIDIEFLTKPVTSYKVRGVRHTIVRYLEKKVDAHTRNLCKNLDVVNLALYGVLNEVKKFDDRKAIEFSSETKSVISKLIKQDTTLRKIDYFDNKLLKLKFKNTLKNMYRIEALLDSIMHKDVVVLKTNPEIIDGVTSSNSRYISRLLS